MKEKTSVTLSREVLANVDRLAGSTYSRSSLIERILRAYFAERARRDLHRRDLELINQSADALNTEANDVLDYQFDLSAELETR